MKTSALALLTLALALPSAAQNLLVNGSFGSDVSRWVNDPESGTGTLTWSSLDVRSSPGSGSGLITNTSANASGQIAYQQCLPATAGLEYYSGARLRVPSGQARTGLAFIGRFVYSNADCTSSLNAGGTSPGAATFDTWEVMGRGARSIAPSGTRSVSFSVHVRKNEAGGTFQAYIDDAFVKVGAPVTLTIPASASIHGQAGTFFHTDFWMVNQAAEGPLEVTLRHRCFSGQTCKDQDRSFALPARGSYTSSDILGTLFQDPETAGAIEITWQSALGEIAAFSRTYTPSLPAPTSGTGVPALPADAARTRSLLPGLVASGGNLATGFRSNVGAYNPRATTISVTFTLFNASGQAIGAPVSRAAGPNEALQVNDVFAAAGAGTAVTSNAYAVVTSTGAVFAYATVIDNQTGDSVYVPAVEDREGP